MSVSIERKSSQDYSKLEDNVLLERIYNGDDESLDFLINKYQKLVRMKARTYFLIGAEKEDIVQEGMIGLCKAIHNFRENKMTSFKSFAELCITRQIITAIKMATRRKHGPLNCYVSLNKPLYDQESNDILMDIISGGEIANPEALIINQEKANDRKRKIEELLSNLERKVLLLYMDGYSYVEISQELKIHAKSIDNALQRIKRKLGQHTGGRKVIS
ncbi:RNA polymerase sporulation sigma factor SigH [Priestia megaterium]|uniref:RNA polymerase sporulation sigma factor SigH n=1 Tax=Priestia megaterium TaxID=1404 RepID=UPI000418C61B|nr:RNA polymerase sporulation sigma factor SigH [Priestia megaterium]RFB32417.1 RNA polymerase sporulation sigma factor SigH [Bacillus sp. RC]MCR8866626.1 RNA polymerase sporulation sigma factor SigH [Priestia megaterium]MDH3178052.1 RNA polymerase sporulation sigma factor SigH [Priestia megaterium]MDN3232854.1 RNA polymerase sporulation sigma factor SigH [Priestia megaterium]MED3929101.1 RNA polymerase sporulation sigma factor SigH [Priestia megaterium]